jgi:magnesium transporter
MTLDHTPVTEALAEDWATLAPGDRVRVFRGMPREEADDFFLAMRTWDQAELLQQLTGGERRSLLRLMPPDDVADLIQQLPEESRSPYLSLIDESTRREVSALLAYQEDVAGGLMSPRFVRLRPEMSVDEALAYVRRQASQAESIHYGYVLDPQQRLLGVLSFRELFAARSAQLVREVMHGDYFAASDQTDQEEVARLLTDHHLFAIPVLDESGRMKGVVTWDDIVDVVQEEASEDIQRFGGSEALEGPYLQVRFSEMVKKRAGWLAILFLGEMLTATAMSHFEQKIAQAVVLALFIPLIISSGGNSGSQAATLVIRAMALGEVRLRDWWRVIRRELAAGLVLGSVLGSIGLARILIWQAVGSVYGEHYLLVALTVAASLVGVVLFGTLAGSMLPLVLRRLGFDPASASAPFVATLVDVTGLIIYFSIAAVLLRGALL